METKNTRQSRRTARIQSGRYGRCIGCHTVLSNRVANRSFVQCQHCRTNRFVSYSPTHRAGYVATPVFA